VAEARRCSSYDDGDEDEALVAAAEVTSYSWVLEVLSNHCASLLNQWKKLECSPRMQTAEVYSWARPAAPKMAMLSTLMARRHQVSEERDVEKVHTAVEKEQTKSGYGDDSVVGIDVDSLQLSIADQLAPSVEVQPW
jgi:hypothetical protein